MSLIAFMNKFNTELKCVKYLVNIRWNGKPKCIYCKHDKVSIFKDYKRFECKACKKRFTVKVDTIFEDSKLPLTKWFMAFYMELNHKKGISSLQLSKDLGVTQKTAWFLLHRIRYVIQNTDFNLLEGIVEVDETYVGGRESNKHYSKKTKEYNKIQGDKTPILGMLQKDGDIRYKQFNKVNKSNIQPIMYQNISNNAIIHTDESRVYKFLDSSKRMFVNHSQNEYSRDNITTNGIEGSFAHFKRTINGVYHWVSKKHMQKYADIFSYRWNTRDGNSLSRIDNLLSLIECRLQYKDLINES